MASSSSFYNNRVRAVTNTALAINAEIATQNAADYLVSAITFNAADVAFLLFTLNASPELVATAPQKVNAVGNTQGDIDTDTAAEALDGNVATGVFADPGTGQFFILYQQLNEVAEP